MKILSAINEMTLPRKILLLVAIPFLSYFATLANTELGSLRRWQAARILKEDHTALVAVTKLIRDLQTERGRSVMFLSATGNPPLGPVNEQRSIVDTSLAATLKVLHALTSSQNDALKALESLKNLERVRSLVVPGGNVPDVMGKYSKIIEDLIVFEDATLDDAPADVEVRSRSFTVLEMARELAGQFRTNLTLLVELDKPVTPEGIQQLVSLKGGYEAFLSPKALEVSPKNLANIQKLQASEAWNKTQENFHKVLIHANAGGFGLDAKEVFSESNKVIDDISTVIDEQLAFADEAIEDAITESYEGSAINLLVMLLTLIAIALTSRYFINKIRDNLGKIIDNLVHSSDQIAGNSTDLSTASQSLSASSQETAAALQETVSSMAEMNSMVSRTRDMSKDNTRSADSVTRRVQAGQRTVEEMLASMASITQANQQLNDISKVITSIGKQTKVINDIVFKTQLLAVNAAIEAAKAGAQGKGFSVVADEVSKLARLSGDAAERISAILDESSEKVNTITSEVGKRVEHGSKTAQNVATVFHEINDEMDSIRTKSEDVNHACQEQSLGIEQVTTAITEIDKSSQMNTAGAQSIERQSASLKVESETLQAVSVDLRRLIYDEASLQKVLVKRQGTAPPPSVRPSPSRPRPSGERPVTRLTQVARGEPSVGSNLADDASFRPAAND